LRRYVSGLAGLLGPSFFRYAQKLGLAFGPPFTSVTPFGRRTAPKGLVVAGSLRLPLHAKKRWIDEAAKIVKFLAF